MKPGSRALRLHLLSLLALHVGCGASQAVAPPEQAALAVLPAPTAAPAVPEAPETPDSPFRYRPPLAESPVGWTLPRVAEVRLPNGFRSVVVEQHGIGLVAIGVTFHRDRSDPIPGIDHVTALTFLETSFPEAGAGLWDAMGALGVWPAVAVLDDELTISFSGARPAVLRALPMLLRALSHFTPSQGALDEALKHAERIVAHSSAAPAHQALLDAIDAEILPPRHRYRLSTLTTKPAADASKIRLADVIRRAKTMAVPSEVGISAVGDITAQDLTDLIDPMRAIRASGPAPKAPELPKFRKGVFVIEPPATPAGSNASTASKEVEVALVIPGTTEQDALPALTAVHAALTQRMGAFLHANLRLPWREAGPDWVEHRRDAPFEFMVATVAPAEAATALRGMLETLDGVAGGGIDEAVIADARRRSLEFHEHWFVGTMALADRLVFVLRDDRPGDSLAQFYAACLRLDRPKVEQVAREVFKHSEARAFVYGDPGGSKEDLAKLGLGPVIYVKRAAGKGRP